MRYFIRIVMTRNRESGLYDIPTHLYVMSARIVRMHAVDVYDVDTFDRQAHPDQIVDDAFELDYLRIRPYVGVERLFHFGHAVIGIAIMSGNVCQRVYAYDFTELP